MNDLRKCPFCGGEADMLDYGLGGARKVVQCSDCGARTRAFNPKVKRGENAIDAWNSRVCDDDCVSRRAAIEVINAVFPVDPMKSEYAQGIACGAALAKTYVEQLPSAQPEPCEDAVSRNAIIQKLNTMDRYVSEELRLCDTDKKFPKNEVFIVDDVYEEIVENLPSVQPERKGESDGEET